MALNDKVFWIDNPKDVFKKKPQSELVSVYKTLLRAEKELHKITKSDSKILQKECKQLHKICVQQKQTIEKSTSKIAHLEAMNKTEREAASYLRNYVCKLERENNQLKKKLRVK